MLIVFRDASLKKLCEAPKAAQRKLGAPSARKLRRRLADLEAARNVTDLVAGKPHPLQGDWAGHMAVSLHGGDRLVFRPADESVPTGNDGTVDWTRVTRIEVTFIGDYHG